eukprot:8720565-Pyramimonas_sp.AAC.1
MARGVPPDRAGQCGRVQGCAGWRLPGEDRGHAGHRGEGGRGDHEAADYQARREVRSRSEGGGGRVVDALRREGPP